MEEKTIICITCPTGCTIVVRGEGDTVSQLEGHQCKRGEEYARSEFTHPVRVLTTTVKVSNGDAPLLPVRSDKPLPKELIVPCMEAVKSARVTAPVARYEVVIPNILGTGVNMVATGEMK